MRLRALAGLAPVVLALASIGASPSLATQREACAPGRYLVQGDPIVAEAPGGEAGAVVVAQRVELPGLCEPASKTKLRGGKKATRVTATWQACAGFRGRPKLSAKVVDDCSRLVGTLRARKYKRKFEALRSRCGDGVLDEPSGEQCEPPASAFCDDACRALSPPHVALRAAPASGVAPLATTFEAVAEDPEGRPLAFHWSFGDGSEADGSAVAAHTYTQPGTYRCTVSVSNGESEVSAAVLVDVGGAGSTTPVGPAGGEVALGRLRLAVPAGLLPQAVDVAVLELPALGEAAAALDPARFRPIGPAYRLDLPLRAADPLELVLAWREDELPPGFAHLGVLWRVEPTVEGPAPGGLAVALVPDADAAVEPATHTLRSAVTGSAVVQAVAMAEPLLVHRAAARASAAPQAPLVIVSFLEEPPDPGAYADAVRAAVASAYQGLVAQRGFPAPGKHLTVTVASLASLADAHAAVPAAMPQLMLIDPDRVPLAALPSVIAHEYFHVVQFWSSNEASVHDGNRWFIEGAAEWARDELLDGVAGHYRAPTGKRFHAPLDGPFGLDDARSYQTVAFWKWLESAAPGMVRALVDDQRARTRIAISPTVDILNAMDVRVLDGLVALHPALDFLDFALAALWSKDYDLNEREEGDLWHKDQLGLAKQVPADLQDVLELSKGAPGDGEANPLTVDYVLGSHLTAATQQLAALDGSLTGTLHLRFPARTDHRVGVAVVSPLSQREVLLHDLSSERTVEMGLGAGDQVVVIETDGDLEAAGSGLHAGSFEAWVEPCGGPTGGSVVEVDSASALRDALLAAQPGDTVKLAAGTYQPAVTEWPFWDVATISGVAMVPRGVTLAGAGTSATTIVARGDGSDLYLKDGATIRDLTLRFSGTWQGVWAGGLEDEDDVTRSVSLCNVAARFEHRPPQPSWSFTGITFEPAYAGSYEFEMHGSTVDCSASTVQSRGIEVWPSGPKGASQQVSLRIRGSTITGCDTGLSYMESSEASVDLDAECGGFTGNRDENVSRCECSTSPCVCTEECPG